MQNKYVGIWATSKDLQKIKIIYLNFILTYLYKIQ